MTAKFIHHAWEPRNGGWLDAVIVAWLWPESGHSGPALAPPCPAPGAGCPLPTGIPVRFPQQLGAAVPVLAPERTLASDAC